MMMMMMMMMMSHERSTGTMRKLQRFTLL